MGLVPAGLLLLPALAGAVQAQAPADTAAIRAAAVDYAEGWSDGEETPKERRQRDVSRTEK